jgi:hypothetical protein
VVRQGSKLELGLLTCILRMSVFGTVAFCGVSVMAVHSQTQCFIWDNIDNFDIILCFVCFIPGYWNTTRHVLFVNTQCGSGCQGKSHVALVCTLGVEKC